MHRASPPYTACDPNLPSPRSTRYIMPKEQGQLEILPWRSAVGESIIHFPIVCIAQASFFPPNKYCMCISPVHHESCSIVRCSGKVPGAGVRTADQTRLFCLHNASAGLIIPRFCTLSGKIINRIPRREGIKSQKADRILAGFCLRMRYRNRAQEHSLAQEALQLFRFPTSLVDIPSKVVEVLPLVENVPRGQIRRTELKPRATNAPVGFGPVRLCYS